MSIKFADHVRQASTLIASTRPRPPIPSRICNALSLLGLPLPPAGSVLPIATVDQALTDADATLHQRVTFKSDLAKLRIINP
jgi:hypothetical protein